MLDKEIQTWWKTYVSLQSNPHFKLIDNYITRLEYFLSEDGEWPSYDHLNY